MKYLLFCGPQYYPGGGIYDLEWTGESIEDAQEFFATYQGGKDWGHIVSYETMAMVAIWSDVGWKTPA